MKHLQTAGRLAALLLVTAPGCASADGPEAAVQAAIAAIARRVPDGHRLAVVYEDLSTGARAGHDPDRLLHAASTMKVPVMIELFRRADRAELDLDTGLLLQNRFTSIVDGSPFTLDPADDSDPDLYAQLGAPVTLRELIRRMIVRSSNLATNALIEIADPQRIQATVESLGATHGMQVRRGVEDGKAFAAGRNNVTTAADLAALLGAIATGRAASASACAEMIAILEAQEFDDLIPAGLPPGTTVAHKTGSITRIQHDAAIVDPAGPRPYVLVVLTAGWDDEAASARLIADVARAVHAAR